MSSFYNDDVDPAKWVGLDKVKKPEDKDDKNTLIYLRVRIKHHFQRNIILSITTKQHLVPTVHWFHLD